MRGLWITATATAEALGIAGVALAYAAGGRGLVAEAPAILAAGAWEGLCLGTAQALILARLGIAPRRWLAATVAVAVLGYAGSLGFAPTGAEADAHPSAPPPLPLMLGAAAGIGLALGAVMGAVQVLVASAGRLPRLRWVLANMAGWALAMPLIFAGSALVGTNWPLAAVALTGAGSGALAGAALGLATGFVLPRAGPA